MYIHTHVHNIVRAGSGLQGPRGASCGPFVPPWPWAERGCRGSSCSILWYVIVHYSMLYRIISYNIMSCYSTL